MQQLNITLNFLYSIHFNFILMKTSQTYKDDISKSWLQYKENPHIQKNKVTNEFRCKTCRKKLGDNAGGVGGHCKSDHDMKIDGTFLSTENKTVEKEVMEREEGPVIKETSTDMYMRLFGNLGKTDSTSSSLPVLYQSRSYLEPYHLYYPERRPSIEEQVEENVDLWKKCIEYKKEGMPTKLISPLLNKIGLDEDELNKALELEFRLKDQKLLDFSLWMIKHGFEPEIANLVYCLRRQELEKTHLRQLLF